MDQRKQSHKTIFTFYGVAEILLFIVKITRSGSRQYSFLSKKLHEILISKTTAFLSCAQDSQWVTKQAKFFFPGALLPNPQAFALWTKPQKISH